MLIKEIRSNGDNVELVLEIKTFETTQYGQRVSKTHETVLTVSKEELKSVLE